MTRGCHGRDRMVDGSITTQVFSGVRVARSLLFCVVFCRSLVFILFFFFWPVGCLSFALRRRASSSSSNVAAVVLSVISHESGKDHIVITASGTYPWSPVTYSITVNQLMVVISEQ
jgi:hypothetical protein